jgi:hypothetical protein
MRRFGIEQFDATLQRLKLEKNQSQHQPPADLLTAEARQAFTSYDRDSNFEQGFRSEGKPSVVRPRGSAVETNSPLCALTRDKEVLDIERSPGFGDGRASSRALDIC